METELPDLATEPEGEATSLQDDLLDASDRVLHRQVSAYQVDQHKRMAAIEQATAAWANEQLARGYDAKQVDFVCFEHLRQMRLMLRAETHDYLQAMRVMKGIRDRGIAVFCQQQHA